MGTHYNCLIEAILTSTNNLCFEQKYEKISEFLSQNFVVVKLSAYLNRFVLVVSSSKFLDLSTGSKMVLFKGIFLAI